MKNRYNGVTILITFLLFFTESIIALSVSGTITDHKTGKPIPFVNIWEATSKQGTMSDIEGHFTLSISSSCELEFTIIGYHTHNQQISIQNKNNTLNIRMISEAVKLDEINVKANFNSNKTMFEKVIENKHQNNKKLKDVSKYGNYDRTIVLMASDSSNHLQRILRKDKEALIHDKEKDCNYIPIYMAEEISSVDTEQNKKDILSQHKDGIFPNLNDQIESMVLEKIAIDFNFYKNQISVLDRGFRSPLSNNALLYYRIYLCDSVMRNDTKHYKFEFYPRNKHATVFNGHFWVEDESFALVSINATLPEEANINFIKSLQVIINFEKQENGNWFYKDQKMKVNFSIGNKATFSLQDTQNFDSIQAGNIVINRSLNYLSEKNTPRKESDRLTLLSQPEMQSCDSIETKAIKGIKEIKNNATVKGIDKIGNMFLTGYLNTGKLDIGPVFDIYSTNYIEGQRVTIPLRTNEQLFENLSLGGYIGYGFKNEEVKYGLSTLYQFKSDRRTILALKYADDYFMTSKSDFIQFVQENPHTKGNGNLLSAITSTTQNPFVFQKKKISLSLRADINNGMEVYISPYYHQNFESEYVPFVSQGTTYDGFENAGTMLNFRFSFDQKHDELYFSRVYYGNIKPVVNLSFDGGKIITLKNSHIDTKPYLRTNLSIKHRFNIGQASIKYLFSGGYMVGGVPYTMLENPYGTKSLGYSRYSYNLLNYATFSHNLYANLHVNLNFGGLILNHIPGVTKLRLREAVSFKTFYGKSTSSLESPFDIPNVYQQKMSGPYAELGVGIANIFKVFRIEYVQRLTNSDQMKSVSSNCGIRMRFEASF